MSSRTYPKPSAPMHTPACSPRPLPLPELSGRTRCSNRRPRRTFHLRRKQCLLLLRFPDRRSFQSEFLHRQLRAHSPSRQDRLRKLLWCRSLDHADHNALGARVNPRFDPRMKVTRCATFSSAISSSWRSASSRGIADLNKSLYAFFKARIASSENPARFKPTELKQCTRGWFPSVTKKGNTT